jgi:hypothetical protein
LTIDILFFLLLLVVGSINHVEPLRGSNIYCDIYITSIDGITQRLYQQLLVNYRCYYYTIGVSSILAHHIILYQNNRGAVPQLLHAKNY